MSASGPSDPSVCGRYLKFGDCVHLGKTECHAPIMDHCDLDLDFVSRIIMSGAHLLYYLRYGFNLIL